jgi:CHAT domain-containing protein
VSFADGQTATIDWFESVATDASIIHLANHALNAEGDADRTGVLLAICSDQDSHAEIPLIGRDGKPATPEQGIAALWTLRRMWRALRLDRCPIAVLAGCHTSMIDWTRGVGNYMGIAGGWIEAGARSVVGSNWPVHDLSTLLLTASFYKTLLGNQVAPSDALWRAQCWLRSASIDAILDQFAALISGWLYPAGEREVAAGDLAALLRSSGAQLPFEHPAYWGSFRCFGI